MLTSDEIQTLRDTSLKFTQPIQEYIISDICERLAVSGKFTATADYEAYRAETLGLHWKQLKKEIAKRLKITQREVEYLYEIAAQRSYMDDVRRLKPEYLDFTDNPVVQQITKAAIDLAGNDLFNITRTMGMVDPNGIELPLQKCYASTMDFVFENVSYGTMDYNTAVRLASTRLAEKGVTIVGYQSGVKTSLEVAARRNIMGGLGLMVEKISQYNHDALGANGWEMSAHAMSAEDHEPHQGKQYTDAEWIELNGLPPKAGDPANKPQKQGKLKRRVGTLNCGHNAFSIIIGVNQPQHTEEQLQKFIDDNAKGVTVDGKHYTMYKATQHQRGLERKIRHWNKQYTAAKATGDADRILETQGKLTSLRNRYKEFSKAAGLRTQEDRLYISDISKYKATNGLQNANISDTLKTDQINSEAVKATLHTVEENKRNFNYEVGTIVDRKGNILNVTDGDESSVSPPVELLKGNIFTHNHPSGGTFSIEDVRSFVKYEAYAVRASTPQGIVYSLKHTGKHDIKFSDDMYVACAVANAHQLLKDDITLGKYTAEYAQKNIRKLLFEYLDKLSIDWLKKNAKKYGYIFEVGDI